ncbi:cupin domain-containing protein [Gemella cuniculi]|uniref:cupin domain-containing protein n=1 Tax=Gemella cuniculi TaxID=150240 RepID=UPI0003F50362|nr:cupin domain-containing protein [Gemella cuniculi]
MKIGVVFGEAGLLKKHDRFKLVKKVGEKGDLISRHNHPEALVVFTVVKGKVQVFLNDSETYVVEPGKVLHFDGDNYINAEFLEDGEVFVTLIHK